MQEGTGCGRRPQGGGGPVRAPAAPERTLRHTPLGDPEKLPYLRPAPLHQLLDSARAEGPGRGRGPWGGANRGPAPTSPQPMGRRARAPDGQEARRSRLRRREFWVCARDPGGRGTPGGPGSAAPLASRGSQGDARPRSTAGRRSPLKSGGPVRVPPLTTRCGSGPKLTFAPESGRPRAPPS